MGQTFISLNMSGFEDMLSRAQKMGANIDNIVEEVLKETADGIETDIKTWATKHTQTGAILAGVGQSPLEKEGDAYYIKVGIDTDKSKQAWHAAFVEYGTPTQQADPGIRTAFKKGKSKMRKILIDRLKREGISID